jgi:predicted lysophospholipase L1 biosynthesis ABC-type transport system permease subunit
MPPGRRQPGSGIVFIVVETAGDPGPMIERVQETLLSANPDFRTYGVKRLSESLDTSFWQARFELWVLGVLGMLALVLAAVGMYGVIAYHVTARTREIGIRMAIGAQPASVTVSVVTDSRRSREKLAAVSSSPRLNSRSSASATRSAICNIAVRRGMSCS